MHASQCHTPVTQDCLKLKPTTMTLESTCASHQTRAVLYVVHPVRISDSTPCIPELLQMTGVYILCPDISATVCNAYSFFLTFPGQLTVMSSEALLTIIVFITLNSP